MGKLKVLDLFSGIGGFSLGLERARTPDGEQGFETVAFCEIEDYPRRVLAKHWPNVPIYEDVRTLNADGLGRIDCVVGGYPCQPFSQAGKRLGAEDDRHLWPEMHRIVASARPRWVIAENVAGHINMGLDQVLSDLESEGYTAVPVVIPACAVDAPHRRDRVWIVAHARHAEPQGRDEPAPDDDRRGGKRRKKGRKSASSRRPVADASKQSARRQIGGVDREGGRDYAATVGEDVSNTNSNRREGKRSERDNEGQARLHSGKTRWEACRWLPEPDVGRVVNGVSRRVDRLKCLGNAVVPQISEMIGKAILEAENGKEK